MMKKQFRSIAFLLAIVICASLCSVFASASSTEATPTYTHDANWGDHDGDGVFEVSTPEELLSVAAKRPANGNYDGKIIRLTADIDLNPGWDASSGTAPTNVWQPMWEFKGTFDGQGHSIKGIYVSGTGSNSAFIVNANGNATITDVKFENCYFNDVRYNAATICASVKSGAHLTISNVYSDAIVSNGMGTAGGFVSITPAGASLTIENSVFAGSVTSVSRAAAFVGNVQNGTSALTITDCANYGEITVTAEYAGGILGCCGVSTTLTRVFNAGTVSAPDKYAAIGCFPQDNTATITFNDVYYDTVSAPAAIVTNENTSDIVITYEGKDANDIKSNPASALVANGAFTAKDDYKGWVVSDTDITFVIPAVTYAMLKGHNYAGVVTAPTCSERGYTTYTCTICGDSYQGDFVDTIPHTPAEDWVVVKEPTEKYAGSRQKLCSICGEVLETEILPKLESTETTGADVTTEAPDDQTNAPADDTNGGSDNTEPQGGCASSITLAPFALVATLSLAALKLGKRK